MVKSALLLRAWGESPRAFESHSFRLEIIMDENEDTGGLLGIVIGVVIGLPILTIFVFWRLFFMN